MTAATNLAPLLERFFSQRLMQERRVSPHTIGSYRDTFRLFLKFTQQRLHKPPSALAFEEIDAPLIVSFLDHLERQRRLSVRSRNLRLTAIHSFFRYAAFELPTHSAQIQRVLAIPSKRFTRTLVRFLTPPEVDALLAAPDRRHLVRSTRSCLHPDGGPNGIAPLRDHRSYARRSRPRNRRSCARDRQRSQGTLHTLAKPTAAVLNAWLREPPRGDGHRLFPNAKGERLSVHGVEYMLTKHAASAARVCPSLSGKRVTVHLLRHTMALELLQAGVDRAVIALWLGHESVETTQIYLEATLSMKEQALAKTSPRHATPGRYRPGDQLLNFLSSL